MRILILFLLALTAQGQMLMPVVGGGPSCISPAGTTFTEPFDNLTANAWATASGAAPAIAASPGTPTTDTACAFSARFNAAGIINSMGAFPTLPAGSTYDIEVGFYLASVSASIGYPQAFRAETSTNSVAAGIYFYQSGKNLINYGGTATSNTSSNAVTITPGGWHTLKLHVEGASSTYQVDAGTAYGFTAGNFATQKLYWQGFDTADFYIGWMRISSTAGAFSQYVSLYMDFENGSNGDNLSTAILNAGTHGGNGAWSFSPGVGAALTVSTSAQQSLPNTLTFMGATYDSGATRGVKADYTQKDLISALYTFSSTYNKASYCAFVYNGIPTNAGEGIYFPFTALSNTSDFANIMTNNGKMYLETAGNPNGDPDTGEKYTYSNEWYAVSALMDMNTGASHQMAFYACRAGSSGVAPCSGGTWQQVALMSKANNASTATPARIIIGLGDNGAGGYYYIDNITLDFRGHFPNTSCLTGVQ